MIACQSFLLVVSAKPGGAPQDLGSANGSVFPRSNIVLIRDGPFSRWVGKESVLLLRTLCGFLGR